MRWFILLAFYTISIPSIFAQERERVRMYGIKPGVLNTGSLNAITDVQGVKVGHFTLIKGDSIRTGVTAILPHHGNLFQQKVPAAVFAGNGFGNFKISHLLYTFRMLCAAFLIAGST